MRVEDPEQRVGDLGKLVVEPVVHAGGEEGETFEQPSDVRIVDAIRRQPQPPGDLRMRDRKLGGKSPDRIQLAVVVREQGIRHRGISIRHRRRHTSPSPLQ
jgi:hypothetical protein